MRSAEAALRRLCDPDYEVSSHYLIGRCGRTWQLVSEERRAWHAGHSHWAGAPDVNSRSIGIELDNDGRSPFTEPLMRSLEALMPGIMQRWNIKPESVIAHSDCAPVRKCDPGRRFDWKRLAHQGLSVWPGLDAAAGEAGPARFRADAIRFGYPDEEPSLVLDAFRQRFQPWADGPLKTADVAAMADLAARYPVDRDANEA
ncbi:N-acetylmuramoyl-L-alanine amidase [Qingshengfaniella alkalisoli]|uniref:N-acetylmuramoyl-L-alanine amidase n=2 Tax=Qingshengfaniella alkalisoli TaxID=2599296 RepID=A0A5B8J7F9_9RHOB|nr:N-acetylmuramoyl-L-alanine amidase [Qingshengfaniella alkalisoli]